MVTVIGVDCRLISLKEVTGVIALGLWACGEGVGGSGELWLVLVLIVGAELKTGGRFRDWATRLRLREAISPSSMPPPIGLGSDVLGISGFFIISPNQGLFPPDKSNRKRCPLVVCLGWYENE